MCRVLLNSGLTLISADRGLAPRALRDISVAGRAGRFTVDDPELALSVAGGALLGLGQLLHDQPERSDTEAADRATRDVLIMFGLPADEAAEICRRPLPDLDELTEYRLRGVICIDTFGWACSEHPRQGDGETGEPDTRRPRRPPPIGGPTLNRFGAALGSVELGDRRDPIFELRPMCCAVIDLFSERR